MMILRTTTPTATNTNKRKKLAHYRLSGLLLPLVVCSLVFLSPSSNADVGGTGPNGGVITSETTVINPVSTTIIDLGGGLQRETVVENHVTTIIENVTTTTQVPTQVTTQVETQVTNTVTTEVATETQSNNYLSNPSFDANKNAATDWTVTNPGNKVIGTKTNNSSSGCYGTAVGGRCAKTGPSPNGSTFSQTVDLFDQMNETSVQRGFDMTYGARVGSHSSNANVPNCQSNGFSAAGGDCKDSYSIGMTIKDSSGTVLHNFLHEFNNISFTGFQDNYFTQAIPSNSYTSALATLELFGRDMGFTTGSFGPSFDEAVLRTTFDVITFVTSQVVETILQDVTNTVLVDVTSTESVTSSSTQVVTTNTDTFVGLPVEETPIETTPESATPEVEIVDTTTDTTSETSSEFTVEVTNNNGETIQSFEVAVETNLDTGIAEITVTDATGGVSAFEGPVAEVAQVDTQVAQVETQIETQVEAQVEAQVAEVTPVEVASVESNTPEPTVESTSEPAETSNTEPATVEVETESSTETSSTNENTSETTSETTESTTESEQTETTESTTESEPDQQEAESSNESSNETESSESEETNESSTETAESEAEESSGSKEKSKRADSKSDSKTKPKPKQVKSKAELKKQIAAAVVTKIVEKLGNDSVSQGTQLALMNLIGADLTSSQALLTDRLPGEWYNTTTVIPDQPMIPDPYSPAFNLAHDRSMDKLTNSQYPSLK